MRPYVVRQGILAFDPERLTPDARAVWHEVNMRNLRERVDEARVGNPEEGSDLWHYLKACEDMLEQAEIDALR